MRQTNVRGNLSLRGFRKLRTGAIVATGVILLGLGFLAPTVSANEQDGVWIARTVAEVKADIQKEGDLFKYVIKWGDTLSVISEASNIPVDVLQEMNQASGKNLFLPHNELYFTEAETVSDTVTKHKIVIKESGASGEVRTYEVLLKKDQETKAVTFELTDVTEKVEKMTVNYSPVYQPVSAPIVESAEESAEELAPVAPAVTSPEVKEETEAPVVPKAEEAATTPAPKSEELVAPAPKAEEPSTPAPKAEEPAATEPTSEEPTTPAPKAEGPSTPAPKVEEPSTPRPKVEEPVTPAPKAEEPVTPAPKVEEPATPAPKAEEPATPAPKAEEPATPAPKVEEPATPAPKAEEPATPAPKEETPVTPAPKVEEPATPAPKEETPATPAPKEETPATPAPKEETPATPAPKVEELATPAPKDDESASSVESPSTGNHSDESGTPSETPTGDSTSSPVTSGETNPTEQPAGETGKSETTSESSNTPSAEATNESGNAAEASSVIDNAPSNTGAADQPVASNSSSESPATSAPKSEEPVAPTSKVEDSEDSAPKADEPSGTTSKSEEPVAPAPKAEEPATPAPKEETPATPTPKAEEPATPTPKAEEPVSPTPKVEEPATPAPKEETPATPAPKAEEPVTPSQPAEGTPAGSGVTETPTPSQPAEDQPAGSGATETPAPAQPADDQPAAPGATETPAPSKPTDDQPAAPGTTEQPTPAQPAENQPAGSGTTEDTPADSNNQNNPTEPKDDVEKGLEENNSELDSRKNIKLEEIESSSLPSSEKEAAKLKVEEYTNKAKEAMKQAKTTDDQAAVVDNYSDDLATINTPGVDQGKPDYTNSGLSGNGPAGTHIGDNNAIGHGNSTPENTGFRNAPVYQPRVTRRARSVDEPQNKVSIYYNFDGMKDIPGFFDDLGGKNEVDIPKDVSGDALKSILKARIDKKKAELERKGYKVADEYFVGFDQADATHYDYVVTFTKEKTGTTGFRIAPEVQVRAKKVVKRDLSNKTKQINIYYNLKALKDIAGALGELGGENMLTVSGDVSKEDLKRAIEEKTKAQIEKLKKQGFTVTSKTDLDQIVEGGDNYDYVIEFTKEAKTQPVGTTGFRMAPAVQPRASRNRRSLEQPAPQKVKVNVFYNFDKMKDIAGFLGDIDGTSLEIAEGLTPEQVKAAAKSQVEAKREELSKRGYTFKEDYVYQANGKDYNYVVTFSKATK